MEGFFAVDLGGARITWGSVDNATARSVGSTATRPGNFFRLINQIEEIFDAKGGQHAPSWGLCVSGEVDERSGVVRSAPHLGIKDGNILTALAGHVPRPVLVCDAIKAAALGEARSSHMAFVSFGGGVAGAVVDDGRLLSRLDIGHLCFKEGGAPCSCGRRGCVEAYAGWLGMSRRAGALMGPVNDPLLVWEAAQDDRRLAAVVDESLEAMAFAVAVVMATHEVPLLRLGGGLPAAWQEVLLRGIYDRLGHRVRSSRLDEVRLELGRRGTRAALEGLAALAA